MREGSIDAPIRHPIDWESDDFSDPKALFEELKRVFDICNGCRRCFNLCETFPKLFDLIDETPMGDVNEVDEDKFWGVIDNCYLCDICFKTKCPYVPPHEFNVDFPHLMLRAKALKHKQKGASLRDKILSNPETLGSFAGIPIIAQTVNAFNKTKLGGLVSEKAIGIDRNAPKPKFYSQTARKELKHYVNQSPLSNDNKAQKSVVLFATCYGNRNDPQVVKDTVACFEKNNVPIVLTKTEKCCGMPKLELGDIDSVANAKDINVPELYDYAIDGHKIISPIPSCVLMFKQELPLLFPNDEKVKVVAEAFMDPFDYLFQLEKQGKLNKSFQESLGSIFYQVPCHLRVQSIGLKTRDVLELVPDTKVTPLEKCSGHDGTYGVKKEFRKSSVKIAQPIIKKLESGDYDSFTSDCPMVGAQIDSIQNNHIDYFHPMTLLRKAYGE
jgi:Fe-S oxidoreductase